MSAMYEDVVETERLLDDVAGEKLERRLGAARRGLPVEEVDENVESKGQGHPERRPPQGLSHARRLRIAVEDTEIESEEQEHDDDETDPERKIHRHPRNGSDGRTNPRANGGG
jgi:hypothetical protein